MAEYWKSTPKYWCKFCELYVRDTGIERKNHEASAKHQGNIQRSLRELHKGQAQKERDAQRAKSEIARLNGLVGSHGNEAIATSKQAAPAFKPRPPRIDSGPVDYAAHQRAQIQQLTALGMAIPDELKDGVGGAGTWQTVSRTVIDEDDDGNKVLDSKLTDAPEARVKGVHKRKIEDGEDEDLTEDATARKRKAWGNSFKSYPGQVVAEDDGDLDALLTDVSKKRVAAAASSEASKVDDDLKQDFKQENAFPAPATDGDDVAVKHEPEETAVTAPPIIAFKKRKSKR